MGESVESALSALAAHSVYLNNFRQTKRILTRRDKKESYLIVLQKKNV